MKKLKYMGLHIMAFQEEQWQSYGKGWLQLKLPGDSFCLLLLFQLTALSRWEKWPCASGAHVSWLLQDLQR